jgi:hypothetical protein
VTEEGFGKIATRVAHAVGRPIVFAVAFVLLTIWAASGPFLGYSDAWQLVVNTATTIITFLMVFLIQNTQNRDSLAVQIKLDELIAPSLMPETTLSTSRPCPKSSLKCCVPSSPTSVQTLARMARTRSRMPTGNVDKAADELHHTVGVTIARRHEKHSTRARPGA